MFSHEINKIEENFICYNTGRTLGIICMLCLCVQCYIATDHPGVHLITDWEMPFGFLLDYKSNLANPAALLMPCLLLFLHFSLCAHSLALISIFSQLQLHYMESCVCSCSCNVMIVSEYILVPVATLKCWQHNKMTNSTTMHLLFWNTKISISSTV